MAPDRIRLQLEVSREHPNAVICFFVPKRENPVCASYLDSVSGDVIIV